MKTIKIILISLLIFIAIFYYIIALNFGKAAYKSIEIIETTKKNWKNKKEHPLDTIKNQIILFTKDTIINIDKNIKINNKSKNSRIE